MDGYAFVTVSLYIDVILTPDLLSVGDLSHGCYLCAFR